MDGEQALEAAAAAADAERRLLGKQLADASLVQARRALNACHVAVLLLDAPRLLTIEQVGLGLVARACCCVVSWIHRVCASCFVFHWLPLCAQHMPTITPLTAAAPSPAAPLHPQALTRLELQLAGMALAQGKALIVALNKADAVQGGPAAAEDLREEVVGLLEDKFLEAGRLPVLLLSALQGQGTDAVMDAVVGAYSKWNKK